MSALVARMPRTTMLSSVELVRHFIGLSCCSDIISVNHSKPRKLALMRVLIVRNNSNHDALDASMLLVAYFTTQSIECAVVDVSEFDDEAKLVELERMARSGLDLAVVLGGDGTILRTAGILGSTQVPLLGINFGHLGFLANDSQGGVIPIVARALAGELVAERRANLRIDVVCEGDPDPFDKPGQACGEPGRESLFALNEVALTRGAMGRIVEFSLDISDSPIACMRGDGVVVASATGSTAYALSAGGPLVAPSFNGLIVVPLAPHTLRSRAVLTGENDVVCVTLSDEAADREASLFVDGGIVSFGAPVRRIYVRRGEAPTVLLRSQDRGFYTYASEVFF